jgi:anti-sigma factor RsiW
MPDLLRRLRRRDRGDLTCRELVELVTDYLDDAMPARERARVERHLSGCPACTRYLDQIRATVRITGRLREQDVETMDPAVRRELVAAFASGRHR